MTNESKLVAGEGRRGGGSEEEEEEQEEETQPWSVTDRHHPLLSSVKTEIWGFQVWLSLGG